MRVLEAASRCTVVKFIPGNMAHFFLHRMTDPVSALLSHMDEQDDNYPNLACQPNEPGTLGIPWMPTTSHKPCWCCLWDLGWRSTLMTWYVKPSLLSLIANDGGTAHQHLVVGNYTLSVEDMDTLKHTQWQCKYIMHNIVPYTYIYIYWTCHIYFAILTKPIECYHISNFITKVIA